MALLFADEDVPYQLVEELRALGHDVCTAHEAGRANAGIPDRDVLAHATSLGRAVIRGNRDDFRHLHLQSAAHAGIITFSRDNDLAGLAADSCRHPTTPQSDRAIDPDCSAAIHALLNTVCYPELQNP